MNTETGELKPLEEVEWLKENQPELSKKFKLVYPTEEQIKAGRVRLTDPCPCKSGKKFGKCCFAFKNKASRVKR